MVSSPGPPPQWPSEVVHFNSSKILLPGGGGLLSGRHLGKPPAHNRSPEKAPDQGKQNSGQVMQVDWVEREEHLWPTLLSSVGITETSESDEMITINQVMDLLWKTVWAHNSRGFMGSLIPLWM